MINYAMLTIKSAGLTLVGTISSLTAASWSPIVVSSVTTLGPQLTPDVSNVSRDGGYSALINGHIVYLYDDTECLDFNGDQLSFISNTAAYASQPDTDVVTVNDLGVISLGTDTNGAPKNAILADTSVETGGWIPFQTDELDFNERKKGIERVAIWPGTSPTPISTTNAFLFSPLVYVDSRPQDPSKEYQARGMTLISITAPASGPLASRQGDLVIPGNEVAFGGFSSLIGRKSTNSSEDRDEGDLDVYLLGMTTAGLQMARVGINDIRNFGKYTFWDPLGRSFVTAPPDSGITNSTQIYLPGTYSSGSVFYSPFFRTFIMVYFNRMVDSTFYIRYLDLGEPLTNDKIWVARGVNGSGIEPEDVEALVRYPWSDEQKLYAGPTGKGGFNYAGVAHPEYFNRQYFQQSQYPNNLAAFQRQNQWYGEKVISLKNAIDGQNLLLSWTSQIVGGGLANGVYEIQFAVVEFGAIPGDPEAGPSSTSPASPSATAHHRPLPDPGNPHDAVESVLHTIKHGNAVSGMLVDWNVERRACQIIFALLWLVLWGGFFRISSIFR